MNNQELIYGVFALLGFLVWIATVVMHQKTITALTAALQQAKSDPRLVDELHALATGVVPVETLHKALDTLTALAAFAKTVTPDAVDQAIDAGTGLAKSVVDGTPFRPAANSVTITASSTPTPPADLAPVA